MLIPVIQYQDANKAIYWLEKAFGFKPHLIVPAEHENIAHAQLLLNKKMMLMVSSIKPLDAQGTEPTRVPNSTSGIYVVVPDPDAHCKQAVAAGAEILTDIADQDYGGRAFTCMDLEGNVWSFGSYDPFA